MTALLALPDELLLKTISWIPFKPRSHAQLPLVCRRFRSIMYADTLPGMIAWYQFSPFMRLLEAFRGRSSILITRSELIQTWKSLAKYRDWIYFLMETTRLDRSECLTAVSIVHFMAATNKKLRDAQNMVVTNGAQAIMFLPDLIQAMTTSSILLLRYIIKATVKDAHDRHFGLWDAHVGFDMQNHGAFPEEDNYTHSARARNFLYNCALESSFILLEEYRPLYNNLADDKLYKGWLRSNAEITFHAISAFACSHQDDRHGRHTHVMLGILAFHARATEISEEGYLLNPLGSDEPEANDLFERLDSENQKIEAVDAQLDQLFSNATSRSQIMRDLDLEGIGQALKNVFVRYCNMKYQDLIGETGQRCCELYDLYNAPLASLGTF